MEENRQKQKNQDAFDIRETLGHRFRLFSVGMDRFFHIMKEIEDFSLPRGQGAMMGYLVDNRDQVICQKDLEKVFCISGATVSNMLSSMEKAGLIKRIQMEEDARLRRIVPTEKGIYREDKVREQIRMMEAAIVEGFSEEEEQQVREYLDRINANLNALCDRLQKD